jgi:23S rRNA (cytosine1962-C5)-methyltransferase
MQTGPAYELLDVGGGARLERFGAHTVDRPAPGALGARDDPTPWLAADLRFDRDRGWTGAPADHDWTIDLDQVTLELRPTETGQVGLFPEHLAMLPWLRTQVRQRPGQSVLNLFAYTGLATLVLAAEGSAVTHVDSARPTVAWARRNAERSGLADRPIRWIVDDALGFVRREARRSRRYTGVVLDPPSYGHGPRGTSWRMEDHLGDLLEASARVLEPGAFVLLTAHTPGFDGERLADEVARVLRVSRASVERGPLFVATGDGRRLDLGAFARWTGAA